MTIKIYFYQIKRFSNNPGYMYFKLMIQFYISSLCRNEVLQPDDESQHQEPFYLKHWGNPKVPAIYGKWQSDGIQNSQSCI